MNPQKFTNPEMRVDEELLMVCRNQLEYDNVGWNSKRRGETAYSDSGVVIPDAFPVFILIAERAHRERRRFIRMK